MKNSVLRFVGFLVIIFSIAPIAFAQKAQSEWVKYDQDKKIIYKTTALGDQIMDFSHAGYEGGGVPLPTIAATIILKPSGKVDDTPIIQEAIDKIAKMPLKNGFKGAFELSAGVLLVQMLLLFQKVELF